LHRNLGDAYARTEITATTTRATETESVVAAVAMVRGTLVVLEGVREPLTGVVILLVGTLLGVVTLPAGVLVGVATARQVLVE
jgi:hypothetical protein